MYVMMAGESDTVGVEIDEAGHEQSAAGQSARVYICSAKPCVLEPVALEQEIRRAFEERSVRLHIAKTSGRSGRQSLPHLKPPFSCLAPPATDLSAVG